MTFADMKQMLMAFSLHPLVRRTGRALQIICVVGVCYYMIGRISAIGWQEVMRALPATPWFYLFFTAMYFAFPIAEWLVYRRLWGDAVRDRLDVFIRMRIYNYAVFSYAGEAYLALWSSQNLQHGKHKTLATIKDSNILSALSSNTLTIVLLVAFFASGQLTRITGADPSYPFYAALAFGLSIVLIPLVVSLRKQIFFSDGQTLKTVFLIHLIRLVIVVALQIGQWSVVMPAVGLETWLLFLTAQYVLTRIPFLPNTDLLFAGVGLTLLSYVDASPATLAGLFVASGALSQLLNLTLFAGLGLRDVLRDPVSVITARKSRRAPLK